MTNTTNNSINVKPRLVLTNFFFRIYFYSMDQYFYLRHYCEGESEALMNQSIPHVRKESTGIWL